MVRPDDVPGVQAVPAAMDMETDQVPPATHMV